MKSAESERGCHSRLAGGPAQCIKATRGEEETLPPRCADSTELQLAAANRRIARLERERRRNRARISALEIMATTDPLTDLVNRRRFDFLLRKLFRDATRHDHPLSVIMVDVDWFKEYNDRYGHSAGDFVLCAVALELRSSARDSDVVARYGGDEFAIILREADQIAAIHGAERLRAAIMSAVWPHRPITASFGVSSRNTRTTDAVTLLTEADRALYHSKKSGRTRVIHSSMIEQNDLVEHERLTDSLAVARLAGETSHEHSADDDYPNIFSLGGNEASVQNNRQVVANQWRHGHQ